MVLTLLTCQLITSVVLFLATILCGILPTWIGTYVSSRSRRHPKSYQPLTNSTGRDSLFDSQPDCSQDCSRDTLDTTKTISTSCNDEKSSGMESATWQNVLSFLMNLGGGVLFATSILHMLPEVRESFISGSRNSSITDEDDLLWTPCNLPLTELLVSAGFFIIYLAEELAHTFLSHKNPILSGHNHEQKKSPTKSDHPHHHHHDDHQHEEVKLIGADQRVDHGPYGSIVCIEDPHHHHHRHGHGNHQMETSSQQINSADDCDGHVEKVDSTELPMFRCIMIVFALSFHSVFDGLAIGLQDSVTHMLQLLLAISVHKLLIAFVVGLQIYSTTNSSKMVAVYMLPFSLMSPLGVITAAYTKCQLSGKLVGILTGISTGSLLYITFFEILFREKTSSKLPGLVQLAAVFVGFLSMASIQAMTEHD